jgi:hypothetical protein
MFLRHIFLSFFVTDPRIGLVYGRRQPRTNNANFEFKRREGTSSAHEITEEVPVPLRRSKRTAGRIKLPRGAMRIEDSEPESTSSDDDEETHIGRNPPLPSHLQQLLRARERAKTSTQLAMSTVKAPERMTVMMTMRAYQFLDHNQLRVVVRLTSM